MANIVNTAGIVLVISLGILGIVITLDSRKPPFMPGMLAFYLVLAISGVFDYFNGTPYYADIGRMVLSLASFGIVTLAYRWPKVTHKVLVVLVWVVTLTVWLEYGITRTRAGLGNVNMTASLLLLLMPWGGGFMPLLALLATGSRGALIGAGIAYLVKWRDMARWVLPVGMAAIMVAFGVLWAVRPTTVEVRIHEAQAAIGWFVQRPVLGWGPGATPALYNDAGIIHFDNAILTVLVELGLVGLIAYGLMVGNIAAKVKPGPARWGLLAWCVHQFFDDTLWWPWVFLALCANIGLGLAGYVPEPKQRINYDELFNVSETGSVPTVEPGHTVSET